MDTFDIEDAAEEAFDEVWHAANMKTSETYEATDARAEKIYQQTISKKNIDLMVSVNAGPDADPDVRDRIAYQIQREADRQFDKTMEHAHKVTMTILWDAYPKAKEALRLAFKKAGGTDEHLAKFEERFDRDFKYNNPWFFD